MFSSDILTSQARSLFLMYRIHPYLSYRLVGRHLNCRVLASMFSSEIQLLDPVDSFFNRIRMIGDPKASISPVLDQWNTKYRPITRVQGLKLIHELKESNRLNHAFEWMNNQFMLPLTQDFIAVGINLTFKVKGLDRAEKFFNSISPGLKGINVYRALLGIYIANKSVGKAEVIVQQMKNLGSTKSPFYYNALIGLYSRTGNLCKIEGKISEMEEAGILRNSRTLKHHMFACVSSSKISAMEKILTHIKNNPSLAHWEIYALAAILHVKSGSNESALLMLKECENNLPEQERSAAIGYLIPLYALTGKKDDVYRIWNQYAGNVKGFAKYAIMIHSLIAMRDLEEAVRVFWEWDKQTTVDDGNNARVLNPLIRFYCAKGLVKKARLIISKAAAEGKGSASYERCWEVIARMHLDANEMGEGIAMMKRALRGGGGRSWKSSSGIVRRCLRYLALRNDAMEMDEFVGLIEKCGPLTIDVYRCLLRVYLAVRKDLSGVITRMRCDGMDMSEIQMMIRRICKTFRVK